MRKEARVREAWINDHLDLYVYAGTIGDTQWQQDIIVKLQNADKEISDEAHFIIQSALWKKYDEINSKILSIYQQLRTQGNKDEQLQEEVWELKLQRVSLARKIQEEKIASGIHS